MSTSMWLEGPGPEPRALGYCLQGLYERWLRRLDEADVPIDGRIVEHDGAANMLGPLLRIGAIEAVGPAARGG